MGLPGSARRLTIPGSSWWPVAAGMAALKRLDGEIDGGGALGCVRGGASEVSCSALLGRLVSG